MNTHIKQYMERVGDRNQVEYPREIQLLGQELHTYVHRSNSSGLHGHAIYVHNNFLQHEWAW